MTMAYQHLEGSSLIAQQHAVALAHDGTEPCHKGSLAVVGAMPPSTAQGESPHGSNRLVLWTRYTQARCTQSRCN